jgi:hypothetical protein
LPQPDRFAADLDLMDGCHRVILTKSPRGYAKCRLPAATDAGRGACRPAPAAACSGVFAVRISGSEPGPPSMALTKS